ncbi:MAG: gamma-glutamylcyclotransferase [Gammaproteobacteria bacterium]|nr:MAG: gamma-glutamylcyclotransferase [Gammaproteobacteria bacterium]UCH39544.1 MAG: gamma-glutamylcyclotransferase [Gammaproteobacteria bacterium]
MLRYIVWRLLFELCNLWRLLGHGSERVQYLAFGANLSEAIMNERRIRPFAMKPFTLRDHGLRFDHPGPWIGCAYASVEPAIGESVYGFLYTLSLRDAARMDFYEAVPIIRRYRRTWVEQDGERLYYYQTNRSTPGLKPTDEYLGYIVSGLEAHPEVCGEYREAMKKTETGEPGRWVSSYLWKQPEGRSPWLRGLVELYQRIVLMIFLKILYRYSLTAFLIRYK